MDLQPLGDCGVLIPLGTGIDEATRTRVASLANWLDRHRFPGMIEYVPGFTTIAVYYDPARLPSDPAFPSPFRHACALLEDLLAGAGDGEPPQPATVDIPVCYGGDFGPDLPFVAEHSGLAPERVVEIHASGSYRVFVVGFVPGFAYLGGMSDRIAAPRRGSPRTAVPRGSVGIAGAQTGVYPVETPGGWQLIGRTPIGMFDPARTPPALLAVGDIVRFRAITPEEFDAWR